MMKDKNIDMKNFSLKNVKTRHFLYTLLAAGFITLWIVGAAAFIEDIREAKNNKELEKEKLKLEIQLLKKELE